MARNILVGVKKPHIILRNNIWLCYRNMGIHIPKEGRTPVDAYYEFMCVNYPAVPRN